MAAANAVDVAIVGCGLMGCNLIGALSDSAGAGGAVDPRVIGLIDSNPDALELAKQRLGASRIAPHAHLSVPYLQNALGELATLRRANTPLLLYDATPAHFRLANYWVFRESFPDGLYWGEKPFALSRRSWRSKVGSIVRDDRCFCDFTELVNPAFLAVLGLVSNDPRKPRRLSFWRANSLGVQFALGVARGGVEGGSLFDKAAHDIALAGKMLGWQSAYPTESTNFHGFVVHPTFASERQAFATVRMQPVPYLIGIEAETFALADLSSAAHFHWTANHGDVDVRFLSSWRGFTSDPIEKLMSTLGSALPGVHSWQIDEILNTGDQEYFDQEVRAMSVELEDGSVLFANLLNKRGRKRFVVERTQLGEFQQHYHDDDVAEASDGRQHALILVLERILGGSADDFSRESLVQVQERLFDAQGRAQQALAASDVGLEAWFKKSVRFLLEKIGRGSQRAGFERAVGDDSTAPR